MGHSVALKTGRDFRAEEIADEILASPEKYSELLMDRLPDYIPDANRLARLRSLSDADDWHARHDARATLEKHCVALGLIKALMDGDMVEFQRIFTDEINDYARDEVKRERGEL